MKTFKQYLEMAGRPGLKTGEKKQANNKIYAITSGYHDKIPLKDIFDALAEIGVHAVQEDGEKWQGMLIGGAECGSDETRNQVAHFDLVRTIDQSNLNNSLFLSWCKMQSGKYEIVAYVS